MSIIKDTGELSIEDFMIKFRKSEAIEVYMELVSNADLKKLEKRARIIKDKISEEFGYWESVVIGPFLSNQHELRDKLYCNHLIRSTNIAES